MYEHLSGLFRNLVDPPGHMLFLTYLLWHMLDIKPSSVSRYVLNAKEAATEFYRNPVLFQSRRKVRLRAEDIVVILRVTVVLLLNVLVAEIWAIVILETGMPGFYALCWIMGFCVIFWFINRQCLRYAIRHFRPDLLDRF